MGTILRTAADRTSLRRTVRVPCEVVCAHSFQLLARETVDLSLTGMAVRALMPATHNTPAFVTFRIPDTSLYVDVDAVIRRMGWGRRDQDAGALLGLHFVNLCPVDRAILSSRLRGLPPPAPARRLRMDYARSVLAIAHGYVPTMSAA